jgi:hypothetical protein
VRSADGYNVDPVDVFRLILHARLDATRQRRDLGTAQPEERELDDLGPRSVRVGLLGRRKLHADQPAEFAPGLDSQLGEHVA